jgi:glycosyltransferase involved in cell wall biosynthesis
MRILYVMNYYQHPGGEHEVFEAERTLLETRGNDVWCYTRHNDEIPTMSLVRLAAGTLWNQVSYQELRSEIRTRKPDVAHFHNTFPLVSPAAYYAAHDEGIPVVQTLHNYRLLCPNSLLYRDGHVCEECLTRTLPWPAIIHACYRESRPITAVIAAMLYVHRMLGTWTDKVDLYLALSEFPRDLFIAGGLPAEKIVIKPNFVAPDPGVGSGSGNYALFIGRLSVNKGLDTVLQAWKMARFPWPLKIVGEGPMAQAVADAARTLPHIEVLSRQPRETLISLMKHASVLVCPSVSYEGGPPRAILEAYAVGLPVIGSNLGSMQSCIIPGRTGLHFRSGDAEDLATQVEWVFTHPERLLDMRREARRYFEQNYTADQNYARLMGIYELAIERSTARRDMQKSPDRAAYV